MRYSKLVQLLCLIKKKNIADCLNQYFASENLTNLPNFLKVDRTKNFAQVSNALKLKISCWNWMPIEAVAPTTFIQARILKCFSNSLASPLCTLFKNSFKFGIIRKAEKSLEPCSCASHLEFCFWPGREFYLSWTRYKQKKNLRA